MKSLDLSQTLLVQLEADFLAESGLEEVLFPEPSARWVRNLSAMRNAKATGILSEEPLCTSKPFS